VTAYCREAAWSVSLEPGERWPYRPPEGHDVAWVAVHEGALETTSTIAAGELAIFEPAEQSVEFVARGRAGFVLGSAARHPYDLVLGDYSVHTSVAALRDGQQEILRIGRGLRADGTIGKLIA
jgi:hypothetical protein